MADCVRFDQWNQFVDDANSVDEQVILASCLVEDDIAPQAVDHVHHLLAVLLTAAFRQLCDSILHLLVLSFQYPFDMLLSIEPVYRLLAT